MGRIPLSREVLSQALIFSFSRWKNPRATKIILKIAFSGKSFAPRDFYFLLRFRDVSKRALAQRFHRSHLAGGHRVVSGPEIPQKVLAVLKFPGFLQKSLFYLKTKDIHGNDPTGPKI